MSGYTFSGNTSFSGKMNFGGSGTGFLRSEPSPATDFWGSRRTFESVVRPFQTIESAPPELAPVRRLRPGEGTEASICAGAPSRFLRQDLDEPVKTPGPPRNEVRWPDRDEDSADDPGVLVYDEVDRQVSVIRIENPEDAAQYVDVERIEQIDFTNRATGTRVRFVLKHDGF
jgi:hypothetical protein